MNIEEMLKLAHSVDDVYARLISGEGETLPEDLDRVKEANKQLEKLEGGR